MHRWLEEHAPIAVKVVGPPDKLRVLVADVRARGWCVVADEGTANTTTMRFKSKSQLRRTKIHAQAHHRDATFASS
ncbi:hypothetical protein QKT49_gp091 [Acanthamoeba castellanii medusavirus]|uniref:Uncharacterized protein n=1 Tax=Acanthamoeba castellanii medusavirus J1 TaxID=3114988 RepID=A0A3T1CWN2_9VIRU|nr:hypothetical protein QKT49_gp091 [Acanthamoeba castellanii medusavirus]BBI30231.1 hypothetical protein [Acanthamoeba castellanii medusavirus J1]